MVDAYTQLLLHMTGPHGSQTFVDSSQYARAVTAVNHAQIDANQVIFADGCLLLDGDDYLFLEDDPGWTFGTGDFTVELRLRYSTVNNSVFLAQYGDGNNTWYIAKNLSDKLYIYCVDGMVVRGYYLMTNSWSPAPVPGTSYHIVFERYGAGALIFIDGMSQPVTTNTPFGNLGDIAGRLYVGGRGPTGYNITGREDEVRISKGIARWITDFTPPTTEYGWAHKIMGISNASISKINGIQKVNIAKVLGV
jgi:hypothetical protein